MVLIGRMSSVVVVFISVFVAAGLENLEQAFQFIQEYTGMVSPGITAIFVFGMYWKRTTSNAAFWGTVLSIPISIAIKYAFSNMPFLDQMMVSFLIVAAIIVAISFAGKREESKGIDLPKGIFKTSTSFNILSLIIIAILFSIYTIFW